MHLGKKAEHQKWIISSRILRTTTLLLWLLMTTVQVSSYSSGRPRRLRITFRKLPDATKRRLRSVASVPWPPFFGRLSMSIAGTSPQKTGLVPCCSKNCAASSSLSYTMSGLRFSASKPGHRDLPCRKSCRSFGGLQMGFQAFGGAVLWASAVSQLRAYLNQLTEITRRVVFLSQGVLAQRRKFKNEAMRDAMFRCSKLTSCLSEEVGTFT